MDDVDTFTIWQLIPLIRDEDLVSVCWMNASMACAELECNALLSWWQAITGAAQNSGSVTAGRKFRALFRWELMFRS